MNGIPLHPAVVHLPIGLALVVPVVAVSLAIMALLRHRVDRTPWAIIVVLQVLVVTGGLVAMRTGEGEEERVAGRVPEVAIERHEERAEVFVWIAAGSMAAGAATVALAGTPVGVAAALTAALASAGAAGAAVWVGHAGGELVYRHGAAGPAAAAVAGGIRRSDDD